MTIDRIAKELQLLFWIYNVCVALLAIAFESGFIDVGSSAGDKNTEFLVLTVVELVTIGLIPCALRLFKFGKVISALKNRREGALRRFAILRLAMLEVPLLLNVVFYYVFMEASFGYMAMILVLCLAFVYPGKGRCYRELDITDADK